MSSSTVPSREPDIQAIRESFGRVVYSHKTHEKAREIESTKAGAVRWINITLTTLTSGTLLSTIITNEKVLLYISSILSAVTLAFVIFQLSFDPQREAERHREVAKELWYVREKYIHLLADVKCNPDRVDIAGRRDELIEELRLIYKFAPDTSKRAYEEARKALKVSEEMTFSEEEIDQFLPEGLRAKSSQSLVARDADG